MINTHTHTRNHEKKTKEKFDPHLDGNSYSTRVSSPFCRMWEEIDQAQLSVRQLSVPPDTQAPAPGLPSP